jgi:hypothetical protein
VPATLLCCISSYAQQPSPAFHFDSVVRTGATIGGETLSPEARFENVAINNRGEVAFVSFHWPISEAFGSAVLTPKRVVAKSFDHIENRILLDFVAPALAIDEQGRVIYEATYLEDGTTHVGVFREERFLFAVNGPGSADDFTLSPDGRVVPKPGIAVTPPAPKVNTQPNSTAPAPKTDDGGGSAPQIKLKKKWLDVANKYSPVAITPDVLSGPPKAKQPPPSKPIATQSRPDAPAPVAVAQPARPTVCPLPVYPMPAEWVIGADLKGPITSSLFDGPGPAKPRAYESPFFGHMASPFRTVHFAADCSPQVIVIGDAALRGKFELWTPQGLLTVTQLDGYLQLPGFSGKGSSGDFVRRDAPLWINQRGQIAMSVSIAPEGYAIVLATPLTGR